MILPVEELQATQKRDITNDFRIDKHATKLLCEKLYETGTDT